jgi:SAM-dependent methyltransferase
MEIENFVEQYNAMPAQDRKAYVSQMVKSGDLRAIHSFTRGPNARAATRILADMGGRIADFIKGHIDDYLRLLRSDDPKVRMHAAQIIGNTCAAEYLEELLHAIKREDTMFALPSLLLAVGNAKNARAKRFLEEYIPRSDMEKHLYEEKAALAKAMANFTARKKANVRILPSDIVFVTTPNANVTLAAFRKLDMKPKKIGEYIGLTGLKDFHDIYKTRAFCDAYIFLGSCPAAELPGFISARENAVVQRTGVTGYRLEVKSVSHEIRLDIIRKCIAACTRLVNTPSSYSMEIMLDIQEDTARVFLNPLVDKRFDYRKKTVPASIAPGTAACVCAYASEFFNPDARVLDNFCGSGTILYERGYYPHHTLTGVDINAGAIDAAVENNRFAAHHPQFHHMDALRFTAKKYDEIITNMPFGLRIGSHAQNERLYRNYFGILPDILTDNGVAVLYTHEKHLTERLIKASGRFEVLKRTTFASGGLYPAICILRKTGPDA